MLQSYIVEQVMKVWYTLKSLYLSRPNGAFEEKINGTDHLPAPIIRESPSVKGVIYWKYGKLNQEIDDIVESKGYKMSQLKSGHTTQRR